jgi:dTDP-4-dehydrorhamnose reductase
MRVTITGATGQLGRQLVSAFSRVGEVTALGHAELDLADPDAGRVLAAARPEVVVNSAAWTDVDGCTRDPDRAMLLNGRAPGHLAAATDALFVQISTNEVFAGSAAEPYAETNAPDPINPYGASKHAGEQAVAAVASRYLIVRTAWLFGPGGRNFVTKIIDAATAAAARGEAVRAVADEWGNPTWTPALAQAIVAAVDAAHTGPAYPQILHLAGRPPVTRHGWAERVLAARGGFEPPSPVPSAAFPRPAKVPPRAVLDTGLADRLGLPPIEWGAALEAYVASMEPAA